MLGQLLHPGLEGVDLGGCQQPAEGGPQRVADGSVTQLAHQLRVLGLEVVAPQVEEHGSLPGVGEEGEGVVDPPEVPRAVEQEVLARAFEKARKEKTVRKALEEGMPSKAAFEKYGIL